MSGHEKPLLAEGLEDSGNATHQDTADAGSRQGRWWVTEPIIGGWSLEAQAERCVEDAQARRYASRQVLSEDGKRVLFRVDVRPGAVLLPVEPSGGYVDALAGLIEQLGPEIQLLVSGRHAPIPRPSTAPGWKPVDASYRSPYGGGAA